MAKEPPSKYLCISEMDEASTYRWRMFARYIDNVPGVEPFFKPLTGTPQYVDTAITAGRGEARVFEFSPNKRTASGKLDVQEPPPGLAVEVLEPDQLKSTWLEEPEKLRAILKSGLTIPEPAYRSFKSGYVNLAICISSKTGRDAALLLSDPGKIRTKNNVRNRVDIIIEPDPANGLKSLDSIPVIYVDTVDRLTYRFWNGTFTRAFLEATPEYADDPFLPYSSKDYAPVLFNRILAQAKNDITLSNGRSLTKSDIQVIMDTVKSALDDTDMICQILQLKDEQAVTQIINSIKDLLPDIVKEMSDGDPITGQIRRLMLADDDIKKMLADTVKNEWLAQKSKERDDVVSTINQLKDEEVRIKQYIQTIKSERDSLSQDVDALMQRKDALDAELKSADKKVKAIVDKYRTNTLELAKAIGIATESHARPYVSPGAAVRNATSKEKAIMHNLTACIPAKRTGAIADNIITAIEKHMAIAVNAEYAVELADAISVAQQGMTAAIIARTDHDTKFEDMKAAIDDANTQVVLIQGTFACAQDNMTLGLIRHCDSDKILVFSIDDPDNLDAISPVLAKSITRIDEAIDSMRYDIEPYQEPKPLAKKPTRGLRTNTHTE